VIFVLFLPVVLLAMSILSDIRELTKTVRQATYEVTSSAGDTQYIAKSSSQALARLADTIDKITPERQQEVRINLQRISSKLSPMASGLRPLVEALGLAQSASADDHVEQEQQKRTK
jgi:hypothetical protein